jgi:Outer membrane protein beta-barrel domain
MKDSFQNHVDNLFRDMLQFHKKEPGRHVWGNIEIELDKEDKAALVNKNKAGLKKIGALLLLFFFISSLSLYYGLHPVQPKRSVLSANIKKSGTGNFTPNPIKTFPDEPVSIEPNNAVNSPSVPAKGIEMTDPNLPLFDITHSIGSTSADFIPVITTEQVFQSMTSPVNRTLCLQSSVDHEIIKLQQPKFRDRISITPYFSKEFAGYNFTDNDITAPNGKEIEKAERNIFSASVGVYLNYKINKRWMLQTGLSYSWSRSIMDSSQSYAVKNETGDITFKLNTASGFSFLHSPPFIVPMVGDSMATAKTHSELHYITIPLILSYRIPMRRFTLLAGAGMTINVLAHATIETDIYGTNYRQNESEIPLNGLKKINLGLLLKTEIQYRLTSNMAVSLISSFKNTLGPINMNNSSLSAYPYNFGIGAGIVYLF